VEPRAGACWVHTIWPMVARGGVGDGVEVAGDGGKGGIISTTCPVGPATIRMVGRSTQTDRRNIPEAMGPPVSKGSGAANGRDRGATMAGHLA
jgi:hypothetical protein